MYPNLLGFEDSSYVLFFVLGIIASFVIALLYLRKKKVSKSVYLDLAVCLCGAILLGVLSALLFENLYEVIALKENYHWVWKMTFFGGLLGGVIGFLLTYYLFIKKKSELKISNMLVIAPAAITSAHFFGRIGCFLSGCCYGKPTDSWIGITFPNVGKVIPTQLIEAIFLLLLSVILLFLAFKKDFRYTFVIYLGAYSIFRFIIEFYRGDDRGAFLGIFSPSQIWCFFLIILIVPLFIVIKKIYENENT